MNLSYVQQLLVTVIRKLTATAHLGNGTL